MRKITSVKNVMNNISHTIEDVEQFRPNVPLVNTIQTMDNALNVDKV